MRIVIDIPEETKQAFDRANNDDINFCFYDYNSVVGKAIKNGIVILDNPTNGDVIKAMFPDIPRTLEWHIQNVTDDDWWNSPYEPQERSNDEADN